LLKHYPISIGGLGEPIDELDLNLFQNLPNLDHRGEFTRIFDTDELSGLLERKIILSQISMSHNKSKNTRRGLHVRRLPTLEIKFVRAMKGSFLDVLLDCRPKSKSFGSWAMFELSAKSGDGIVIPGGFAHGIQTLEDETIVVYGMEIPFSAKEDLSINSEDHELNILWRDAAVSISEKDCNAQTWKQFVEELSFIEAMK
jgi:dTDP-4-dehydrorhamnose 3,5-epimerase